MNDCENHEEIKLSLSPEVENRYFWRLMCSIWICGGFLGIFGYFYVYSVRKYDMDRLERLINESRAADWEKTLKILDTDKCQCREAAALPAPANNVSVLQSQPTIKNEINVPRERNREDTIREMSLEYVRKTKNDVP